MHENDRATAATALRERNVLTAHGDVRLVHMLSFRSARSRVLTKQASYVYALRARVVAAASAQLYEAPGHRTVPAWNRQYGTDNRDKTGAIAHEM